MKDVMQRNPGTISGVPTVVSPGLLVRDPDPALRYTGGSSFTIPDSPSISLPVVVGGVSFEFIFEVPALPGAQQKIFSKSGSYEVGINAANQLYFFLFKDGTHFVTLGSVTTLQPNTKYHAVCVYNGNYSGTPRIGVDTVGASLLPIPADQAAGNPTNGNNLHVAKATLLEKGRIDRVVAALQRTHDATSPEWIAGELYEDAAGAPTALLEQAKPQLIQPSDTLAWVEYPMATVHDVGDVWLGLCGGSGFAEVAPISVKYDAAGGTHKYRACTVTTSGTDFDGTAPDPFGAAAGSDADKLSVYADYTPMARSGDEGHVLMYLNGVLDNSTPYADGIADSANPVTGPDFDVILDELLFYNRVITKVEVSQSYAAR